MLVRNDKTIYVGNTEIKKVYSGTSIVYEKQNHNYQEVNYIESNNAEYIDTGVKANSNTKFEIDYEIVGKTQWASLFGVDEVNSTRRLFVGIIDNNNVQRGYIYAGTNVQSFAFSYGAIGVKTKATYDGNLLTLSNTNGTTTILCNSSAVPQTTITSYLFCKHRSSDGAADKTKIKIYSAKIMDGNDVIRDYIPVLDANNIPCLYDKITNEFYYNAGSGAFTYG